MQKLRWFGAALVSGCVLGLVARSYREPPEPQLPDANEFLARVVAKYATCESYQDDGLLGTAVESPSGYSTRAERAFKELGRTRPESEAKYSVRGIRLQGDLQFRTCIENAIDVLSQQDPESCSLVLRYLERVEENGPRGIWPTERESWLGLSSELACYSKTYCAALLVYYARQAELYYEYKDKSGLSVPEDAWTGSSQIGLCSDKAAETLKRIGAPSYEIAYVMKKEGVTTTPTQFRIVGDD